MSKVTIELSRDEAARVLNFLGAGPSETPQNETAEKPARKPRAKKEEAVRASDEAAHTLAATGPSLADMLGGTAVEQPKPAVTQKDLIAAFVKLGNDKGIDAVKALLGKYSVATVTAIPQDKWAEVVEATKA